MSKFRAFCLLLIVGSLSLVIVHQVSAAVVKGRVSYQGYFSGQCEYAGCALDPGTFVFPGDGMVGVYTKDDLINRVRNSLGGDLAHRIGAEFIINTMLGRDGAVANININVGDADYNEWLTRLNDPSVTMNHVTQGYKINSYYTNGPKVHDDAFESFRNQQPAVDTIVLYSNGVPVYILKVACANPLGDMPGLPRVPPRDQPPVLGLDPPSCTTFSGWAFDADNFGLPVNIRIIIDGWYQVDFTAQSPRSDINGPPMNVPGLHGFSWSVPSGFQDLNAHSYSVMAWSNISPGGVWIPSATQSGAFAPCYGAACAPGSAQINGGNIVRVGTTIDHFSTAATFVNTGSKTWDNHITAKAVYNGKTATPAIALTPGGGGSSVVTFAPSGGFNAPSTLNHQVVPMNMYYDGTLIASCAGEFDPYVDYKLSLLPTAGSLVPDNENPTAYNYSTGISVLYGNLADSAKATNLVFTAPAYTRDVTRNGSSLPPGPESNDKYGNPVKNHPLLVRVITNPTGGEIYCPSINVPTSIGYVNAAGVTAQQGGPPLNDGRCDTVADKPYARFYNGDVSAGGGFKLSGADTECVKDGSIQTFSRKIGADVRGTGSAVQLGAIAFNASTIDSFASASLRTTAPISDTGLTFAHQVAGGYGDALGVQHCVPNYFAVMPSAAIDSTAYAAGNTQQAYKHTGDVTISSNIKVQDGARISLFVKGNVIIKNNIQFANSSWPLDKVPSFYIVAEGNIYIDANVTQLDGVFIAQGKTGNGLIDTCSNDSTMYATGFGSPLPTVCNKQLTVNGGMIADTVNLNRTFGSLRYSTSGENKTFLPVVRSCGSSGSSADCAAEIFNATPEMYLTEPNITVPGKNKYDYITSLSPIL
ncbi:MAG: hypothetical protein JWM81_732 [Candidatus Saccharibacteria bacterium]|nr:hypothetical protein [Candidatus Saccharibacteria bacterium]